MNIKILQDFIEEFKHKDIDKKFHVLRAYKKIKEVLEMEEIKKILQWDIRCINEKIVEVQSVIDKAFNTMLDSLQGTDEYRKAKIEHDNKSQEKWLYYGRLGAIEMVLKLISDKEERDKLEMDVIAYNYYKSVGAEELPFE